MANADVYVTQAAIYFDPNIVEFLLEPGKPIRIAYPSQAFITVISTSAEDAGSFSLSYSNQELFYQEAVDVDDKPTESYYQSTDFATIVVLCFIFFPFFVLCICISFSFIRNQIRIRNNRIFIINDHKDQTDANFGKDPAFKRSKTLRQRPKKTFFDMEE